MQTSRTARQGWRYFHCETCGAHWRETCRDHTTLSGSPCINEVCESRLQGGLTPYKCEADSTVRVDRYGNLAESIEVEHLPEVLP